MCVWLSVVGRWVDKYEYESICEHACGCACVLFMCVCMCVRECLCCSSMCWSTCVFVFACVCACALEFKHELVCAWCVCVCKFVDVGLCLYQCVRTVCVRAGTGIYVCVRVKQQTRNQVFFTDIIERQPSRMPSMLASEDAFLVSAFHTAHARVFTVEGSAYHPLCT